MSNIKNRHPAYSIKDIKKRIKADQIKINGNASVSAYNDFGWDEEDIKKGLLKLNLTHFYKTERHFTFLEIKVDYYKARGLMHKQDVYIHLYLHPNTNVMVTSSFKRL